MGDPRADRMLSREVRVIDPQAMQALAQLLQQQIAAAQREAAMLSQLLQPSPGAVQPGPIQTKV